MKRSRVPNSYFQFKQFKITQSDVAMKVTTEGCILGGWAASIADKSCRRVLDVGTGTGLLSLMLAQALPEADIFGVELNREAANRALKNFAESPWGDRLHLDLGSVQEMISESFDLIICNPPFYNRSQESSKKAVNQARHDASLMQEDLINVISRLLDQKGEVFVLYPEREAERFQLLALEHELYLKTKLIVRDRPDAAVFRVVGQYSHENLTPQEGELLIKQTNGEYTPEFVELLKEYYLYL